MTLKAAQRYVRFEQVEAVVLDLTNRQLGDYSGHVQVKITNLSTVYDLALAIND